MSHLRNFLFLRDEPQEWLKKHESFKSEQLKTIFTLPWKQGLGIEIRQVSLMGAESSVYILCFLQDLMRTTNFLAYLYSKHLNSLTLHEFIIFVVLQVLSYLILVI